MPRIPSFSRTCESADGSVIKFVKVHNTGVSNSSMDGKLRYDV